MLNFAILVMIAIIIGAILYLGFRWDEAQTTYNESSDEAKAAYVEIQKAVLRQCGKLEDGKWEVDFTPAVIAIVLIALCAMTGLQFCTCFFLVCFAAICIQLADGLKAMMIIDLAEGNTQYATV